MRTSIVAGNWKMHGTQASVSGLLDGIKSATRSCKAQIIVFPPYVYLAQTEQLLQNSHIKWGAQNVSTAKSGAYTGEVSAPMLCEFNCSYVLIGHSERRALFGEDEKLLAQKFNTAQECGIKPIYCVGETLQQREQNLTFEVIRSQLDAVLATAVLNTAIIAYEPVWAIGTGITASSEQAQAVHAFIREHIATHNATLAAAISIIYGGSVKAANAHELFAMPDIDGGLIGGASLEPVEFAKICHAAG